jgi:hypothetical protein
MIPQFPPVSKDLKRNRVISGARAMEMEKRGRGAMRILENDCSVAPRTPTSGVCTNRAMKNRHSIRRGAPPLAKKVEKREFNYPDFVPFLHSAPNIEGLRCAT